MAKGQRHSIPTVRAAVAGVDLFYPSKSAAGKRRKVRKFLRRTRVGSKREFMSLILNASEAGIKRRRLFMEIIIVPGLASKMSIIHELAHFFRTGKNDLLTANAVSGYFWRTQNRFEPKGDYGPWLQDAKCIINSPAFLKRSHSEHKEFDFGHARASIPEIGTYLGSFAADKEKHWKKPASGLFLIREVCSGTLVDAAVKKIESGKFDSEIAAFAKKHFANLFPKTK